MAARTSPPPTRDSYLARFASLTGKATGFIEEGQRSPEMIEALFTSLQMFRDKTLRMPEGLTDRRDQVIETLPQNAQALLSMKLSSLVIDPKLKDRFNKVYGILYVAELYRFRWSYASHENHVQSRIRRGVEHLLLSLNLPLSFDLNKSGWVPPYDTAHNRALLDQSAITVMKAPFYVEQHYPEGREKSPGYQSDKKRAERWMEKYTSMFVGELFTDKHPLVKPSDLLRGFSIHAGAWFPNWTLPKPK
jgi:hypothetical protein